MSTTKAVAFREDRLLGLASTTSTDPIASSSGAIGRLIHEIGIGLEEIEGIALTGVSSSKVPNEIFGIKTYTVDEIKSIGYGGAYLTEKERALVVSIGTGTAIVSVDLEKGTVEHIGGTGVGGGTLTGLSRALLRFSELETLENMAERGDLKRVDLTVGDLVGGPVGIIPEYATASNFGNIRDGTTQEDLSAGLMNMVAQTIGTVAFFAAKSKDLTEEIVYVGGLTNVEIFKRFLLSTTEMFNAKAVVPDHPEYATAIGSAIALRALGAGF